MRKFLAIALFVLLSFAFYIQAGYSLDTYILTLKVEGSDGNPLSDAYVRVTTKYGVDDFRSFFETTNESGLVSFTLHSVEPSAQVRVYLKSVNVAYQVIPLENTTSPVIIRCNASDLRISVLDFNGKPLQGATVKLDWKVDIPWNETKTSENETVVFPQMPYHDGYNVSITWKNRQVYQGTCALNSTQKTFAAKCSVYQLSVNVKDKDGRPVSNAEITLERDDGSKESGNTDTSGYVTFQLAYGNYTVQASYNKYSSETALTLNQNAEVSLVFNVAILRTFGLTVNATWSDGVPANGAKVIIKGLDETVVAKGETDTSGIFNVKLLEGNYTVQVSADEFNESRKVTLTEDTAMRFICDSSLRYSEVVVNVLDENGSPASGANVEVYEGNELVSKGTTNDGTLSFELKSGTYKIIAKYNGEEKETTLKVNQNTALTFDFTKRIDPMSILYLTAIISAAVLLTLLLYAKKKRSRPDPFKDLEKELSRIRRMQLDQHAGEEEPDNVSED